MMDNIHDVNVAAGVVVVLRIPVNIVNTKGHKLVTRRAHIYSKGSSQ